MMSKSRAELLKMISGATLSSVNKKNMEQTTGVDLCED
jgi:hypothetical protein